MGTGKLRAAVREAIGLTLILFAGGGLGHAGAQQGVPPPQPITPYRPPAIALVQPASGTSVPQDRPIIGFRFVAGDSSDPIDARSFAVSVDGMDRSALFQIARDAAWGPLAPERNGESPIALGVHQLAARICSTRGACGEMTATVTVATSATAPENANANRKRTLLDLLLAAARKLLNP